MDKSIFPDLNNSDNKIMLGDVRDYRRFIHKCAKENLHIFDLVIYMISRWNSLLYKAVYELRIKNILKTKVIDVKIRNYNLKMLQYVKVYNKIYYYDNQIERTKFKKWVKTLSR